MPRCHEVLDNGLHPFRFPALAAVLSILVSIHPARAADSAPQRIPVGPSVPMPGGLRHSERLASNGRNLGLIFGTVDARTLESARNTPLLRYSAHGRLLAGGRQLS